MSKSESNFTPALWVNRSDGHITEFRTGRLVATVSKEPRINGDWKANAHLIKAAPEMYEALERMRNELDDVLNTEGNAEVQEMVDFVDAALKKARGEI